MTFLIKLEKIILSLYGTAKTPNSHKNIGGGGGEREAKSIILPNLRLHCKSIVIKAVWYRHKNRHMDQWINVTE